MPKFLSNIDLSLNEIQNVKVHNVAGEPTADLAQGRIIYDGNAHKLKYYDGGTNQWITVGSGSGGDVNQNAFSNFTVGQTTIAATTTTDTLTITQGTGISLTPNNTNKTLEIASSVTNTDVNVNKTNLSARLAQFDGTETLNIGDSGNDTSVVIRGNLTVNGTTTTVNSNEVNIGDSFILLNSDATGNPLSNQDAGIEIERGDATNVTLRWDEADDDWEYTAFDHAGTPALQTYKIPRTFSTTIGDGSAVNYTVTHNLGQKEVLVQLFDSSSGETVYAEVTRGVTSPFNTVTIGFATAPTSNDVTVLITTV
jgi:hypothetical protein